MNKSDLVAARHSARLARRNQNSNLNQQNNNQSSKRGSHNLDRDISKLRNSNDYHREQRRQF